MYNISDTRRGYLSNETSTKESSLTFDRAHAAHIPKIFVVCDQRNTAPIWGYILRQEGLIVILETSLEKALDRWTGEITDVIALDIDVTHHKRVDLYKSFRALSVVPILLLLPVYHETQILDAYAAGIDDVIVKPISPPIFLAKIMAWARRSWSMPVEGLTLVNAGMYRLDPTRRYLVDPHGIEIKLTNLEFRLLHLLMSRPGYVLVTEDIIHSIWGGFGEGDPVMLKNVVYRLRRKIEADPGNPTHLQTGQGGYSFHG